MKKIIIISLILLFTACSHNSNRKPSSAIYESELSRCNADDLEASQIIHSYKDKEMSNKTLHTLHQELQSKGIISWDYDRAKLFQYVTIVSKCD